MYLSTYVITRRKKMDESQDEWSISIGEECEKKKIIHTQSHTHTHTYTTQENLVQMKIKMIKIKTRGNF